MSFTKVFQSGGVSSKFDPWQYTSFTDDELPHYHLINDKGSLHGGQPNENGTHGFFREWAARVLEKETFIASPIVGAWKRTVFYDTSSSTEKTTDADETVFNVRSNEGYVVQIGIG